jgi:hypothetical protein
MDYGGGKRMTVRYVKVSDGKFQCHCGVTTEKGILWDYPGDNYRHFEPICGFCIDDIFKDYDRWNVPTVTSEEIENTQANPELVTAEEGDDKSVLDLLANLARRVTELERKFEQYTDIARDKYDLINNEIQELRNDVEMALDDIVTLDERTQPLVSKKSPVKVVVEEIHQEFNGVFTETKITAYVKGENFRLNGTFEFKGGVKNIDDAAEKVSGVFK